MVAALPEGPSLPEARRRLASGGPLAVGLSRAQTEALQDQLVGLGLVPRIGPAPEGTPHLGSSRARSAPWLLIAAAAIVVAVVLALQAGRDSGERRRPDSSAPAADSGPTPPGVSRSEPRAVPPEDVIPPERRLELWAQARLEPAGLALIGLVRGRGGQDPDGPLTLVARAAGLEVVTESFEKPPVQIQRRSGSQGEPLVVRTVSFRVAVERTRLQDVRELLLEARWGEWRSAPLLVRLPGG